MLVAILYWLTNRNHFRACTTRPPTEHLGQVSKKSDQWSRRRCDNEIVAVLSKGQIAMLRCPPFGHIYWWSGIVFGRTYLNIERNSYARFRQNSSNGFGGDAITVKIKVGCWWPYLSADQNLSRACTTRPLREQLGQVSKKSDQRSGRCNNEKKFMDGRTNGCLTVSAWLR